MKHFIIVFLSFFVFNINSFAQENCDSKDAKKETEEDISKCMIEEWKASEDKKEITVEVTASQRRRRRVRVRSTVYNLSEIENSNELADVNTGNNINVDDLEIKKDEIADKLPFSIVDEVPVFESCENKDDKSACFKAQISRHVKRNFSYPTNAHEKGVQGRVLVQFVIKKDGTIGDISMRTPYQGEELAAEAKRIIELLPKMIPGKQKGKIVNVKYGVPISFRIPGRKPTNVRPKKVVATKKEELIKGAVNFNTVEQIPLFKKCKNASKEENTKCFRDRMTKHIIKNFQYPAEAEDGNVQGKVYVYFVITKNGEVKNVMARGPKLLQEGAKSLIRKLPNFKPGKQAGQNVHVKYVVPINFKL